MLSINMSLGGNSLRHFILTRFNLLLWNKDKGGQKVRSYSWLEHRFWLFEHFCLPSIVNQTCKEFEWIVLFDSKTPDFFKKRISELQIKCPQLKPVFVEPEKGRFFAEIFRREVEKKHQELQEYNGLNCSSRVLTTYIDNDDALDLHYVEDIQRRASELPNGTFIYYTEGYQFYTDHKYLMQIHYKRNHFASVVENALTVKTIYGFGSHYYINKIPEANIEYVKNVPMWCEVIHEKNMGNDAYFLGARMVKDGSVLINDFGLQEEVKYGAGLYLFRFLPRYFKTFIRRCGYFIIGNRFK